MHAYVDINFFGPDEVIFISDEAGRVSAFQVLPNGVPNPIDVSRGVDLIYAEERRRMDKSVATATKDGTDDGV